MVLLLALSEVTRLSEYSTARLLRTHLFRMQGEWYEDVSQYENEN